MQNIPSKENKTGQTPDQVYELQNWIDNQAPVQALNQVDIDQMLQEENEFPGGKVFHDPTEPVLCACCGGMVVARDGDMCYACGR